ncbi:hypothetical protein MMC28_011675 [Mycoblastus sanguinarius]|nr:hypothetical protein [Mycoblastus sanguinarius]
MPLENKFDPSEMGDLVGFSCQTIRGNERRKPEEKLQPNVIEKAFLGGRSRWMEEPVIAQWTTPDFKLSKILMEINTLYQQWSHANSAPFFPFSDPLWLQTCSLLRDAGLPWYNTHLNLPDEIDPSWPFHFKDFERQAVLLKGARVGDNEPAGYVCSSDEANLYGIRALQQELRVQRPTQKPLLVAARIEPRVVQSAACIFGMELYQVNDDWELAMKKILERNLGQRPVIFAATLANDQGQMDDFNAISRLSRAVSLFLHVDAARSFDYLTTLSASARKRLGLPRLMLRHPYLDYRIELDHVENHNDSIINASTIVAGGMNWTYPPSVVVLKPRMLGTPSSHIVEYVRGTDGTLAGSRDALGPLLVCLQELRFGIGGIRNIYSKCEHNRRAFSKMLSMRNIAFETPTASLDMIIHPCRPPTPSLQRAWGFVPLADGKFLITMQPSVGVSHLENLATLLSTESFSESVKPSYRSTKEDDYPLSAEILETLQSRVASWRTTAVSSGGYPFNQAPYSALGPIIGQFLPVWIPPSWAKTQGQKILEDRKRSFAISDGEHGSFVASFTTGSTMGNRIGLRAALMSSPSAYVYFSSASHYSIRKNVRDNDTLNNQWSVGGAQRFAEIPANEMGRMIPEALVQQVLVDKASCEAQSKAHYIILLANLGTTFVGGYDDLVALRQAIREVGSDFAYIHVDGALDIGFSSGAVCLGPPSIVMEAGLPVVQGVTMSHHKAYGIMVSGEVICYCPKVQQSSCLVSNVEPRIIFETWLFQQFYSHADLIATAEYCRSNSNRLRSMLKTRGIATRFNEGSFITILERIPPWMVQDFHLAPEGDWVHYITMPHISPAAVDSFVETISLFEAHFSTALHVIKPDLDHALGQPITLIRIRSLDSVLFPKIVAFAEQYGNNATLGGETRSLCLDSLHRQYVNGAMCFAALNSYGDPVVAFLVKSTAQRTLCMGPVLVHADIPCDIRLIQGIAVKGLMLLSELLGLDLME